MVYCDNIFQKVQTLLAMIAERFRLSPTRSTTGPGKRSGGEHPRKSLPTNYTQAHDMVLRRPVESAVLLGPPGTGKTHLATALAIAAAHAGHRVAFAPVNGWISRLAEAHRIEPFREAIVVAFPSIGLALIILGELVSAAHDAEVRSVRSKPHVARSEGRPERTV